MEQLKFARVAAILASDDAYSSWYGEIFRQIGLVCKISDETLFTEIDDFDVVILCGDGQITGEYRRILGKWLTKETNQLIVTGGLWHGEYVFDVQGTGKKYCRNQFEKPEGTSNPEILSEDSFECLFFGGDQARKLPGTILANDNAGFPIVATGAQLSFFLPHVGQTASLLAMGRGVSTDAIGPDDGSAHTQDGILRAEDGTNLLWSDREKLTPELDPAFLRPHLDQLREQFARLLFKGIEYTGMAPAMIWHLPDNHNAACTVDVEVDSTLIDHIKSAAGSIAKFSLKAAWMVPPPGLPQDVYRVFKSWGHDIGHLYKPENQAASTRQVRVQNTSLARGVGSELRVMKGWDGAWFGLTRMYQIAEETGAYSVLSKSGRQPGTSGFIFGTGRPFSPITSEQKFGVIEIPGVAFAPGWVTPFQVTTHLAQQIYRYNGTFRFEFLTSHAAETRFELNLPQLLRSLVEKGFQSYSPSELSKFELARRRLTFKIEDHNLSIRCDDSVKGLTVLVGANASLRARGHAVKPQEVERYGRVWTVAIIDLDARLPWNIEFANQEAA